MSDFNEFLKAIAEGKKQTIESSPGKKALKQLSEQIHADNPFLHIPPAKSKAPQIEVVGEFVVENGKLTHASELNEVVVPTVKPAAEQVPMDQINKYLKQNASFQQPDPDKVDPSTKAIQDKLKFLEQAIGKIAATGPGSGEVNFRWLDDVNRATMTPVNDNWVLEYDAATGDVQFTEDVGPIRTLAFNTEGSSSPLIPGQLAYNPNEDCLDIRHADGTTLQAGLENHFRVYNNGGTTLKAGTCVGFGGVIELDGDQLPIAAPYTATMVALPLYIMGVLTTDVPPGGIGRATTFGKVRQLDTTGDSGLGETWAVDDLLWAHPTMPGRLTKVQPTSPYPAVSVAAVLRSHATAGVLLVRPTIFPRLWSGDWFSTENQSMTTINTPKRITVNNAGITIGFTNNAGLITAEHTGHYNFQFSLQIISSNSSTAYYYIWYRKNGQDVPHSATKLSISSNSVVLAPSWNFPVSMQAGDTFELMWACDSLNVSISAQPATSFCPSIPSVILTVQQMNL